MQIARKTYRDHALNKCRIKAFVADDSVKIRTGKKMGGVSWYFDHLTGRSVRGQQVLTLGLATESTFLPLDQDIYISSKQIQAQEFNDNRSIAAKRYEQARDLTKPELLALQRLNERYVMVLKPITFWLMRGLVTKPPLE